MMMDIDPLDDGPVLTRLSTTDKTTALPMMPDPRSTTNLTDEEARQCIDWLRSDDVAARVAAAHRLDAVAMVLGTERTQSVRCWKSFDILWIALFIRHIMYDICLERNEMSRRLILLHK
jgi:hypothetical protein